MADLARAAPAVHVAILHPDGEALARFASFGAEEEGVPIRAIVAETDEPVAAAYVAARSSTFGVGLAIGSQRIVLHEAHMPPERAVLAVDLGAAPERIARRFGSNAARLVVRLPLRLTDPAEPEISATPARRSADAASTADDDAVRRIVALVVDRINARGGSS